jgi:hypothetical protein
MSSAVALYTLDCDFARIHSALGVTPPRWYRFLDARKEL